MFFQKLPVKICNHFLILGFTISLVILATFREILGAGTFMGINVLGSAYQPAIMFILPAGGFLTLGIVLGLINLIKGDRV